jgi:type IV pilus assembly protein PilB
MSAPVLLDVPEARALFVTQLDLLTAAEFDAATELADKLHIPLQQAVAEVGRIPVRFLLEQIAVAWGVKFTELNLAAVSPEALLRIPQELARKYDAVPFHIEGRRLSVAMANPRDSGALRALHRASRLQIVPHLASDDATRRTMLLYSGALGDQLGGVQGATGDARRTLIATAADETPAAVLDHVMEYAAATGASDIHIEPFEGELSCAAASTACCVTS